MIPDKLKTFLFFTKYRLWNRRAIPYFYKLKKNQHLSSDELEHLNWDKRKKLLIHAYTNVPYYREKFNAAGLHPNDIVDPEDYQNVPLLQRKDLRDNFDRIFTENIDRRLLRLSTTGGSTGEPVKVMLDKRVPLEAMGWRMYEWWGLTAGLNSALIWRDIRSKTLDRIINQMIWWPALRIVLDASSITPPLVEKFIKRFNLIHPRLLHGYTGAVDYIASYIEQNDCKVVNPKAISVTSSPIASVQRRRIEKVFNCPVYDQYGTCEIFWLSSQCGAKESLHMYHDIRHIEFTDDIGQNVADNELGNIVVTDLENYAFPLIRYVNGDKGRSLPGKCACGINLPLMDQVRGRQTDLIKLPDGSCLAGDYLTTLFDKFPEVVSGFQVQQKKDYSIRIIYVPDSDTSSLTKALESVYAELLNKTRHQVKISMEAVKVINNDKGKLRFVISEV